MMASLEFSNRVVSSQLKEYVQEQLDNLGTEEKPVLLQWVTKTKREKVQERLIVLTEYRFLTIKHGRTGKSIQRNSHLHQMIKCSVENTRCKLDFVGWTICFHTDLKKMMEIVKELWNCISRITKGFPSRAVAEFEGYIGNQSITNKTLSSLYIPLDASEATIFGDVFKSYCAYYGTSASLSLMTKINKLFKLKDRLINFGDLGLKKKTKEEIAKYFRILMNTLEYDNYFEGILVDGIKLGDEPLVLLASTLKMNPNIHTLRLRDVGASKLLGEQMANFLSGNKSLRYLDIACNELLDKGLLDLCKGLRSHPLVSLSIKNLRASPRAMSTFIDTVRNKREISMELTDLDISGNRLGSTASKELSEWFKSNTCRLENLSASLSVRGPELNTLLLGIRKSGIPLKYLDLSDNNFSDEAGLLLSEILSIKKSLKTVKVSGTRLTSSIVSGMMASLLYKKGLNESSELSFDASNNSIGEENAVKIASLIENSRNLSSLVLNDGNLKYQGVAWIFKALTGYEGLKELRIDRNVLKGEWDRNKSESKNDKDINLGEQIANFICKAKSLEILSIAGDPKVYQCVDLYPMFIELKNNVVPELKILDISGNMFGTKGAFAFSVGLENLPKLEELYFDMNEINVGDFSKIVEKLRNHKSILKCPFPEKDLRKAVRDVGDKKQMERSKILLSNALERNNMRS